MILRRALLLACLLLSACGQKGNLYLPDKQNDQVTVTSSSSTTTPTTDDDSNDPRRPRQSPAPANPAPPVN